MDNQIFEDLGFSKGETLVYLALLELQESTIGEINKKSKVTASKSYIILDKLIAKGLVSYNLKGKVKYFQALNPEKLLTLIESREKELSRKKEEIKKIIPRLQEKKREKKQYSMIYEGYNGLETLYDEIINYCHKNKEDFKAFALSKEEYKNKNLEYFFAKYDNLRKQLKVKTRLLAPISQKKPLEKYNKIEIKYVNLELPTGLIIWGDNVAYINWSNNQPTGFVIHSEQIAESNKNFFEELWNKK